MQMVFRTRSLRDASGVRDLLASSGIAAHLADHTRDVRPQEFIQVSVDNKRLDAARRVVAAWRIQDHAERSE